MEELVPADQDDSAATQPDRKAADRRGRQTNRLAIAGSIIAMVGTLITSGNIIRAYQQNKEEILERQARDIVISNQINRPGNPEQPEAVPHCFEAWLGNTSDWPITQVSIAIEHKGGSVTPVDILGVVQSNEEFDCSLCLEEGGSVVLRFTDIFGVKWRRAADGNL